MREVLEKTRVSFIPFRCGPAIFFIIHSWLWSVVCWLEVGAELISQAQARANGMPLSVALGPSAFVPRLKIHDC